MRRLVSGLGIVVDIGDVAASWIMHGSRKERMFVSFILRRYIRVKVNIKLRCLRVVEFLLSACLSVRSDFYKKFALALRI